MVGRSSEQIRRRAGRLERWNIAISSSSVAGRPVPPPPSAPRVPASGSWCSRRVRHGRDKVCGDGLTPRAVAALEELKIDIGRGPPHRRAADDRRQADRELDWPTTDRFPNHGAVWPRRRFDAHLIDAAIAAGAEVAWDAEALPVLEDGGGRRRGRRRRDLHRADDRPRGRRAGRGGQDRSAAERVADEPFGLAIRTYAATPRHAERPPGGVPVAARRARHADPRLRLDVPGRRRHGQHRRRARSHDEGLQEAQPQHAARPVRGDRSGTVVARPVPREAAGVAAADERRAPPRAGLGRHRRCRRASSTR